MMLITLVIITLSVSTLHACAITKPISSASVITHEYTQTPRLETPSSTAIASQEPKAVRTITPTSTKTVIPSPSTTPTSTLVPGTPSLLGYSTNNYPIEVYKFGNGPIKLVLIGGIHGGYEWNTILLAYKVIDYFTANPEKIPEKIRIYIIPSVNPDGQMKVVGHTGRFTKQEVGENTKIGRFNGANVDLNRNWDCNWSPTAIWQEEEILAGTEPFSEVEVQLLKNFLVNDVSADLVIFWHSAAFAVYGAGCGKLYQPSADLAQAYANASGYTYYDTFTDYAVTGDATDWLSLVEIPAITVELSNHTDLDLERNLDAILEIMEHYQ